MNTNDTQIIEINGVKLEVDLRHAKRIEHLRVGSRVKVLIKTYDSHKVCPGVVVGFDAFEKLPTINVCYMDAEFFNAALKFVAINANTKDTEIVAALDADNPMLSRDDVLSKLDREIGTAEAKLDELRQTRDFFLRRFGAYFEPTKEPA